MIFDEEPVSFSDDPKYPDIDVQLSGTDSNAGAIMGEVTTALQEHGVSREEINEYRVESMAGNYQELLQTAMRWVNVY